MEKRILPGESNMSKKTPKESFYKVLVQKTYRNTEGYIFMHPSLMPKEEVSVERSFVMVYHFKKIPNIHNPMFIVESIVGDDFKGRIKIIKHFEENHALEYAVDQDGFFEKLNGSPKKPE